jgi:hypothetical protein
VDHAIRIELGVVPKQVLTLVVRLQDSSQPPRASILRETAYFQVPVVVH